MELKTAEVRLWEDQATTIGRTRNYLDYLQLFPKHFNDGLHDLYLESFRTHVDEQRGELSRDYLRVLTLGFFETAQYGFSIVGGQVNRHRQIHSWSKSMFSLEHQLAITCYMADLNNQLFTFRDRWQEYFEQTNPDLAPAVWGMSFKTANGQPIADLSRITKEVMTIDAKKRIFGEGSKKPKPICLPNPELNFRLAALNFTGDQADKISKSEFEGNILPAAQAIMNKYLTTNTPSPEHMQSLLVPA